MTLAVVALLILHSLQIAETEMSGLAFIAAYTAFIFVFKLARAVSIAISVAVSVAISF